MYGTSQGGSRPLDTFNIAPAHLARLAGAEFRTVHDVQGLSASELAEETGLAPAEAVAVLEMVAAKKARVEAPVSALALLERAESEYGVPSMVRGLDEMLSGGVPFGKITEFCGAPGLGKTQLGIQLAVNVHLPPFVGGPAAECIYIDTEGSFMSSRVAEIAAGTLAFIQTCYANRRDEIPQEERDAFEATTVESIMQSIYYFRVHNYIEQQALIYCLRDRIKNHLPRVKLIVIDSIAFHFRRSFSDYGMRTRMLSSMSQTLIEIAKEFHLAVAIMNQITTKFGPNQTTELVPALGETYAHSSTNRIMLYEKHGKRYAKVLKSPNSRKEECCYVVAEAGISGVEVEEQEME